MKGKLLQFPSRYGPEPIYEGWTREEIVAMSFTVVCWVLGHNWISMGECGDICGRCGLEK